ncbi:peroxisomal dehydratase [Ceraceosorus bombacis]|uniref:Peroxisomal dehydratase n=1 Tax=Ceraceosorus bombacis TaxID=401625 RepID=A0A0P1BP91_9BASI|nr:peroxisomal dehydratase [Ceraceosorus bombacis]
MSQPKQSAQPAPQAGVNFDLTVGHVGETQAVSWNRRDIVLYALGIGSKETELDYVYEQSLNFRPFPTYPLVLAFKGEGSDTNVFAEMIASRGGTPGFPNLDPNTLVHGEQSIIIHEPIPAVSTPGWKLQKRTVGVHDKPSGLILEGETVLISPTGRKHATMTGASFYRGGSQGTGYSKSIGHKLPVTKPPSKAADFELQEVTTSTQAALYRLSGDYNPLHIDPSIGKKGGLPGAILHGLCSYGHAARAILRSVSPLEGQAASTDIVELKAMSARFTSPVLPGDTLKTKVWIIGKDAGEDGKIKIAFEQEIVGGKKSLGGGYAEVVKVARTKQAKL